MFEELQTRGNKGHANVRKNMLGRFRASFLPPEPDAELCFQVYRLIMPQVRLGAAACAHGRRGRCRRSREPCVQNAPSDRSCPAAAAGQRAAGVQVEGAGAGGGDCGRAEHRQGAHSAAGSDVAEALTLPARPARRATRCTRSWCTGARSRAATLASARRRYGGGQRALSRRRAPQAPPAQVMKEIKTSEQKSGPSVGEARGAGGARAATVLYPSAPP